jgi:AcrR family transcriptional regulator
MSVMDDGVKGRSEAQDARRDRWSAHRAQRREEFVAAALRVLAAQGPELPMDAVAAEAGVTKPVLYRYFADKAALVEALGEYSSALLQDRLLPAIGMDDAPALDRIRDGVAAYFSVIDEHPNLYWLLARQAGSGCGPEGDPVHRNREFIAASLSAVFGAYMRAYGLDSGAAEPWGYGLTGLVQSTGEWWMSRRSMSRANVVEYLTQLIWAAVAGILSQAGVVIKPDEPLPRARPGASPEPD